MGLDEALATLDTWQADHSLNGLATAVHRVEGIDLGSDGRARSWVLGVSQGDIPIWLVYGREGMQELSLSAPLPADEIAFDDVVMPGELYGRNRAVIEDALRRHGTGVGDLTLTGAEYVLTIRSGAEFETLEFLAATGEVIPSA